MKKTKAKIRVRYNTGYLAHYDLSKAWFLDGGFVGKEERVYDKGRTTK